jgi:peptide subunit release factor 1 (eRF1)
MKQREELVDLEAQENKAIEIINDVTWQDGGRHYGEVEEARRLAISALEKQIPKNPIKKEEQYKKITVEIYYCPICNEEVSRRSKSSYLCKTPYCDECGQKIDWSEAQNAE